MSSKGMVSVVVPFLNAERFLWETVESVLAQTYSNWELLLADDGSTDASTRMARSWAAENDKIFYLEHPGHENRGVSSSRNLGIRKARGEFIAFLDADDIWLPDKLERQVGMMAQHPEVAMVFGATKYWHSWSREGDRTRADEEVPLGIPADRVFYPPELLEGMLSGRASEPHTCAILVRKDKAESVGRMEDSFTSLFEDQVFFVKTCLVYPVYAYSYCDNLYRRHSESMCAKASGTSEEVLAYQRFLYWVADYLRRQSVEDEVLWRALARKAWLIGGLGADSARMSDWNRRRWVKKQCLKLERLLAPASLQRHIWAKEIEKLRAPPTAPLSKAPSPPVA